MQFNVNKLELVAMFLGAALHYPLPECNSWKKKHRKSSTIKVTQHKSKFSDIRIYCELAEHSLVLESFNTWSGGKTIEDFKKECLMSDAVYYRKCYMDMIDLVPEHKTALLNGASHSELLTFSYDDLQKYAFDQRYIVKFGFVDGDEALAFFSRVCEL